MKISFLRTFFYGRRQPLRLARSVLLAFTALFLFTACEASFGSPPVSLSGHIRVDGSTALQPLVTKAATLFHQQHPQVQIEVSGGGSLTGLNDVTSHKVDIGDSDIYADPATYPDPNLTDHLVCVIPFTMIVSSDVPVADLKIEQLIDIFATGKITNWSELGGPDLHIVPIVRPSTSGTRATFRRYVLGGRDESSNLLAINSSQDVVNTMLDTITGLLNETRQQRDALTGAAEHLFTDMRIVNAGDLRVSATVSNDPIGMLANAFNFTVGRFRRFILRTQTTIEQLEVISRQGLERSQTFIAYVRTQMRDTPPGRVQYPSTSPLAKGQQPGSAFPRPEILRKASASPLSAQEWQIRAQQTQDETLQSARDDLAQRLTVTRETLEKASHSVGRLSELISTRPGSLAGNVTEKMIQAQLHELASLERVLGKLARDIQQVQTSTTGNFAQIDSALKNLMRQIAEQPVSPMQETPENFAPANDLEFQELVRQSGSFAVEVNALAKRLTIIIQEMKTGIIPFRLEGVSNVETQDLVKPAPGFPPSEVRKAPSGNLISSNW